MPIFAKLIINFFILSLFINLIFFISAKADTLDNVKNRGYIKCGVADNFVGFSSMNDEGNWSGFDVDFCKAVAISIFGKSDKRVEFVPLTTLSRFPSLAFGDVDLLVRNTTWSFSRDVNLEFDFLGINFYDGQAFMARKDLEINSILDLQGSTICLVAGSSSEANTTKYFQDNKIIYESILLESTDESRKYYLDGKCDALTSDLTVLASSKALIPDPNSHIILDEVISKEPLGPLIRHGDNQWGDLIRWVLYVLIIADEKGISSKNVDDFLEYGDKESQRMLGVVGNYSDMLELDNDWAYNIIKELGNYGEIFDKNLGEKTLLQLKRGLNKPWNSGGLLYAPPFR
ncbi:MAG: amino acid ABC transporter substrate-binding protein [Pelagibacteraceae bacterium]|nr:amino acid ABC transporter substrate-binding protein [Pelagibacteraceae bacterium]|tara:strand:- start:2145 stop:3179 length:1035 start_codon:yes stop_codon:yes gene_type:complete